MLKDHQSSSRVKVPSLVNLTDSQILKKLLSYSLKKTNGKRKKIKQQLLRVFDANSDTFVNLENVDFTACFKALKHHFNKKSNWLQIHKFYL
jgi:hypothetical protein